VIIIEGAFAIGFDGNIGMSTSIAGWGSNAEFRPNGVFTDAQAPGRVGDEAKRGKIGAKYPG
jgi:hypothetical protein